MAITKLPRSGIADNSVNASKIEDGTVAAAEISGTVSAVKLNATLDISGKTVTLPNTSVTSGMLANTTIANAKLANSTITVRGTSRALGTTFTIGVDVDWQSVVVSDGSTVTTMVAGKGYFINNTSAAGIVKLPTSATAGDTIKIKDYAGNFGTNVLVIQRNGHNIQGVANNGQIQTNRAALSLVYVDATKGWLYTDEHNVGSLSKPIFTSATGGTVADTGDFRIHTFTGDGNFVVSAAGNSSLVPAGGPAVVDYLVVAGGGGSSLGGSGAGGFRESHSTPVSGSYTASPLATPTGITLTAQTYPVTVGGGGAANGNNGSNSIFSTITSAGGGKDAGYGGPAAGAGGSGGGGGLTGPVNPAGAGNTPPVSPPQGNPGGTGTTAASPANAGGTGGGGGAGASGQNSGNNDPGNGGNGVSSEITGSSVARAGGGGGGGFSAPGGTGGSGGGGAGGTGPDGNTPGSVPAGTAGSANTGGGAGGYGRDGVGNVGTAAAGGKGIVVIRYKYK